MVAKTQAKPITVNPVKMKPTHDGYLVIAQIKPMDKGNKKLKRYIGDILIPHTEENLDLLKKYNIIKVEGKFDCSDCKKLTSLEGAPKIVTKTFNCAGCDNLTSLFGCAQAIEESFDCSNCQSLVSLEGGPKKVGTHYDCSGNQITSLAGSAKEIGGDFDCSSCRNLKNFVDGPVLVHGNFDCSNCEKITSLQGAPIEVNGNFDARDCIKLSSLQGAPTKIGGEIDFYGCTKVRSLLGLPKDKQKGFRSIEQFKQSNASSYINLRNLVSMKNSGKKIYKGSIIVPSDVDDLSEIIESNIVQVNGDLIIIDNNRIRSLEGCPQTIKGSFSCSGCTNLEGFEHGAPKKITGDFSCVNCHSIKDLKGLKNVKVEGSVSFSNCTGITSLEGAPTEVKSFSCANCPGLKTLEFSPTKVTGDFSCANCRELVSLKGCPEIIGGDFDCSGCTKLGKLIDGPKEVGGAFVCSNCKFLSSLKGCPEIIGGDFNCSGCSALLFLSGAEFTSVGGDFNCTGCLKLTSTKGKPRKLAGEFISGSQTKEPKSSWWKKEPKKTEGFIEVDKIRQIKDGRYVYKGDLVLSGGNITDLDLFSKYNISVLAGDLAIRGTAITSLEGCPKTIGGNFKVGNNINLKNFEGCPTLIEGNFDCSETFYESLEGCENTTVKGSFNCSGCDLLTSLKGAPLRIEKNLICKECLGLENISDLKKGSVGGKVIISPEYVSKKLIITKDDKEKNKITFRDWGWNFSELKGVKMEEEDLKELEDGTFEYTGDIVVTGNEITDLKFLTEEYNISKIIGDIHCFESESFESFEGCPKEIEGKLHCYKCPKVKNLKGLEGVDISDGFSCAACEGLVSLEGMCEGTGGYTAYIDLMGCKNLTSLEGLPEDEYDGDLRLSNCPGLTSLEGLPKKIYGGIVYCDGCDNLVITEEDHEQYDIVDEPCEETSPWADWTTDYNYDDFLKTLENPV